MEPRGKKHNDKKGKMNLNILKKIRKLAKNQFDKKTFLTIWAACSLAFFTSGRMGEILANLSSDNDGKGPLTWRDIKLKKSRVKLQIKLSKTSNVPEYLYVFCLDNKKSCPVAALQALKKAQLKCNLFDKNKQIFRFENGKNLTKSFLNKNLRSLLS
jgi:hypothetical protein